MQTALQHKLATLWIPDKPVDKAQSAACTMGWQTDNSKTRPTQLTIGGKSSEPQDNCKHDTHKESLQFFWLSLTSSRRITQDSKEEKDLEVPQSPTWLEITTRQAMKV